MFKGKKFLPLLVAAMLTFGVALPTALGATVNGTTGESQATITFSEGPLRLVQVPDFAFGDQPLPTQSGEVYTLPLALDADALMVSDGRTNRTAWKVDATLEDGLFYYDPAGTPTDGQDFSAIIRLPQGTVGTNVGSLQATIDTLISAPASTGGLGALEETVLTTLEPYTTSSAIGQYYATWNNTGVELIVGNGWDSIVMNHQYTATINWVLTVDGISN